MRHAFLAILAALAAAPAAWSTPADGGVQVSVQREDDAVLVTVRAESVLLERVLGDLGRELGFEVEGVAQARRATLVTVDLQRRPVEHVLEVVLGSVGLSYRLRAGALTVTADAMGTSDVRTLLQQASVAYLRALQRYPRHPYAPSARLDQGEVADLSGYPGAALEHYQTLIASYPKAPDVPEAYMRSGLVLERLGRWADAAETFRSLANVALAAEHAVPSRLGLARATVELGDPQNALYLLTALDTGYPPRNSADRAQRALVRARALVGLQRHLEALREIESVDTLLEGADRQQALRVRALALSGAGYPGEAARAWILVADGAAEPARGTALEQAARLALEAGDEVGALFVVRQAEAAGQGQRFARYRDEAYARLGFETQVGAGEGQSALERVAAAEALLAKGDASKAADLVRGLVVGAGALDADLRARLAVVWAGSLASSQGIDAALAYLRATRAALSGEEHVDRRARLDVAAAELCLDAELFDRAADAYRGIY